jgi:hypothetical protein
MDYEVVSIAELGSRTGIDFFPTMPSAIKETKSDLPQPTPSSRGNGPKSFHSVQTGTSEEKLVRIVFQQLDKWTK